MAFTNRCRLQVAAVLRRSQNVFCLSSPVSMPRRLHSLSSFGVSQGSPYSFDGCLNPRYGGVLKSPALVRHFSWWRWGGGNSGSQVEGGEDEAIVEPPGTTFRREDEVGAAEQSSPEPFPGSGEGVGQLGSGEFLWQRKVDIEEETLRPDGGLTSMNTDEILEEGGGSVFWSTLQVPTDAIIVTLDRFQNITGVPW